MQPVGSLRRRGATVQVRFRAAGRETSRSFTNETSAKTFQLELGARSASERDALGWGQHLMLGDVALMWSSDRDFAERTLRTNEQHLRKHILPRLGHIPVGQLTRPIVTDWMNELNLAPKTRQRVLGVLRQILRYGVDHGYVEKDPTAGLKIVGASRRRSVVLPTVSAVEALRHTIDSKFAVAVDVMAYAGTSISELAAMQVGDLDFEDQTVAVRRSVDIDSADGRFVSERMKTPTRDQIVPVVPSHVWERWEPIVRRDAHHLLVPSPSGKLLDPGNFRLRHFVPALAQVPGCPPSLRPHGLRHFACSLWLAAGCSDYDVASWAGHTDVGLIRRTYGHALPREDSEVERVVLGSVLTQRSRPRQGR